MTRFLTILKRVLVGRPVPTQAELRHRVPKRIALAVFSSDALSSSAYATDVMMVVLAAAGTAAVARSIPISMVVVFVLAVVITSYRTTVRAYPQGGGGYAVAYENLGAHAGVIAASALLIDYVLTVAVSIAAGVKAIGAAMPLLFEYRVPVALAVVALITIGNLRGLKESGPIFAVPTYGFLFSMGAVILIGSFRVVTGNYEPLPPPDIPAEAPLTLFLIARAFASGSTALTGVEAIANAAPAFRPPEGRNAAHTLATLGILLGFLFLGITFLANAYHADPHLAEFEGKPIPSQIAAAVLGEGSFFFYVVQVSTALLLFLAANTAYGGFPALASVLGRDRFLPQVFRSRGDKLAYSNGIVILAAAASLALISYEADEIRLIPLYVIGVFTTFTLAQTGLVRRWFRLRTPGWRRSSLINGFGAVTTFVVLIIQAVTKFGDGAWQVLIAIPVLAWLLSRVRAHYQSVSERLRFEGKVPAVATDRVVVLVSPYLGATLKALGFARAFAPRDLHVLAFRVTERRMSHVRRRWAEMGIKIPIEATGHRISDLLDYVKGLEHSMDRPVTLIIPDPQSSNPIRQILDGRLLLRIKGVFLDEPGVVVASVPYRPDVEPEPERLRAPARMALMVVVANLDRVTLRALEYAKSLNPAELKAVTVSLDARDSADLARRWGEAGIDVPLEVVDSPYRGIVQPLVQEVRSLRPHPDDAVGVIVPEFVVERWWQHLLHGQTALMIKTALLFEPNVVVIDLTYPIGAAEAEADRAEGP